MSKRWRWVALCAVLGVLTLIGGWLVPAHLRAVDAGVLQVAGKGTSSVTERGLALANKQNLGAAQLLLRAAETPPNQDSVGLALLGPAVTNLARQHPEFQVSGGAEPRLQGLFASTKPRSDGTTLESITEIVVRFENREKALDLLRASRRPDVQELLRCRALTNTAIFPPSSSTSGQPFDAALSICGLLVDGDHLGPGLREAIVRLATESNHGGNTEPFEQVLLDLMSLGQRFNWGQLVEFVSRIEDAETLRVLANTVRQADAQMPVLFSAVELSGKPLEVAHYAMNFSETGLRDLGASLRYGSGGVNELLRRNQRLYESASRQRVVKYDPFGAVFYWMADYCWSLPSFGLIFKWLLYLAAGYFIATALHFARPAVSALEQPLQVRGFHVAREVLFALGFLLAVLLVSEPFLAQGSQRVELPFRVHLPTVGSAVPAGSIGVKSSFMKDPNALLTLLLFFVLQALLYTACVFKLAEIRRQRVAARIKLRLLENEDHLFDAGLYLGFAGTIISLILVSLGYIKPSLMAAYSSTSFGIIFVSIFKIFHLRPVRRILLLESEAASGEPAAPASARPLAAPL